MKKLVFLSAVLSLLIVEGIDSLSQTSVKQRHDFVKSIIGDLDDIVVEAGLIDDETLHELGSELGLCSKRPGGIR